MSMTVQCPRCQAALNLPDNLLGQAAKCPKCECIFQAPDPLPNALAVDVPPPLCSQDKLPLAPPIALPVSPFSTFDSTSPLPAAPADEQGFDWKSVKTNRFRPQVDGRGWRLPRIGLWAIFSLFLVTAGTVSLQVLLGLFDVDLLQRFRDAPMLLYVGQGLSWTIFLLALGLCCATPSVTRARGLIVSSFLFSCAAFGTLTIMIVKEDYSDDFLHLNLRSLRESRLFWIAGVLSLLGLLLLVLYLRNLATYFRNQSLAENLVALVVLLFISPVVLLVFNVLADNLNDFELLFRLLKPLYFFAILVWIALTLWSLIKTIESQTLHSSIDDPSER